MWNTPASTSGFARQSCASLNSVNGFLSRRESQCSSPYVPGEAHVARAVERRDRRRAVPLEVVAVVAAHEKRRERRLDAAQLPIFDGVDDAEHASADADPALSAEAHFAPQIVADVAVLRLEAPRAHDRRRARVDASPRRQSVEHRPDVERPSFDAVVRARLDDAHRLRPVLVVLSLEAAPPRVLVRLAGRDRDDPFAVLPIHERVGVRPHAAVDARRVRALHSAADHQQRTVDASGGAQHDARVEREHVAGHVSRNEERAVLHRDVAAHFLPRGDLDLLRRAQRVLSVPPVHRLAPHVARQRRARRRYGFLRAGGRGARTSRRRTPRRSAPRFAYT